MTNGPTLLRELIEIPEDVHRGDFVISLAEGVEDAEQTLRHYVVTEQLARAYDNALAFVASAAKEGKSKAAYLDGSFGSGKSHFMAVLHLLLQRDPIARGRPELAETVARHDPALADLSFDLVPFHMIGAESMEQAILGGYVRHLERTDPSAPTPGVFADAGLFEQAELLRAELGEERFFERLNTGEESGDEGWGDLAAAWTPASYGAARGADVGDAARGRLRGAVVDRLVPALRESLAGSSQGYVDIDTGLAELARHSAERGHDALVLFLDELILWLGSRIRDQAFVEREGQKLIKLIEFTTPRPIPIVAFVARQRDLREFIGDQVHGAEKLSFADTLKHWNDRFHRVELHDRNLPKIAERRLLAPRGEAERQTIDAAFREIERERPEVLDVLTTEDGDRDLFRSTYPFSPAFMKTLVAASSALQRERTALRVMLQLLVSRRDELTVGDLVSVGDLFDVLSEHDEPFTDDLKQSFELAKGLRRDHFLPLLRAEHGIADGGVPEPGHAFHSDDRLVKTLLLAALVPRTQPLQNLDVAKLTALNHGSIRSPLPGGERAVALGKLRKWAARVGALKIGADPQNPSVEIRLTGIDLDAIVSRAEAVDNPGGRRQMVKRLVFAELGVEPAGRLQYEHRILWRGTRRSVDIVFGNIRDTQALPDDVLRAVGDRWKVVIDYPFDPGHSPGDDLDRLDTWQATHEGVQTVCWVPAFLSQELQGDLKRLVIVDHVLEGERLEQYADHLSPRERQRARGLLEDHRSSLEQRLRTAIRQAYGVETATPDAIDTTHQVEDRLRSLAPGFHAQVQVGNTLADAFERLLSSMLDHQFPDHPRFETEVRPALLRTVLAEVERAADASDGRIEVPSEKRAALKKVAAPLELGVQYEAAFVLGSKWKDHLDKALTRAAQGGGGPATVGDLRRWLDEPRPLGLTREVGSLVILAYASAAGKSFAEHGGPATPTIDKLGDELELVAAELPDDSAWQPALARASALLGITTINTTRNPGAVDRLAASVRESLGERAAEAGRLPALLERRISELGGDPGASERLKTASSADALARTTLEASTSSQVIERFAASYLPGSDQAGGKSLASAAALNSALEDSRWQVLGLVAERAAGGQAAFEQIARELLDTLARDELADPLDTAIARAHERAVALMKEADAPPPSGSGRLDRVGLSEARAKLDELANEQREVSVSLTWTFGSDG